MTKPKPKLTRESLHKAIEPPNNCQVKAFRETLDAQSLEVFDEAIAYDKKDLTAVGLRTFLIGAGFDETVVPSADHISAHRNTTRPCRCRS